jgi:hypothetical protein
MGVLIEGRLLWPIVAHIWRENTLIAISPPAMRSRLRASIAASGSWDGKRKNFFFEKKKQKTFVYFRFLLMDKSFLVLFFKKERAFLCLGLGFSRKRAGQPAQSVELPDFVDR